MNRVKKNPVLFGVLVLLLFAVLFYARMPTARERKLEAAKEKVRQSIRDWKAGKRKDIDLGPIQRWHEEEFKHYKRPKRGRM